MLKLILIGLALLFAVEVAGQTILQPGCQLTNPPTCGP